MADLNHPVVQQLERILNKPRLSTSPALSRFLRFIVEETLEGRAESINEVILGQRVFSRREDFNPRTDPIVRVQAHHLRAKLSEYYSGPGAHDPLIIELPPRCYVPVFRAAETAIQTADPAEPPAVITSIPEAPKARGTVLVAAIAGLITLAGAGVLWKAHPIGVAAMHHNPDPVAEDLYVRGRYLLDRLDENSLRQSAESFQQAIARDPAFAPAYAGLADADNVLAQTGYASPRETMEQARAMAKKALALDPQLAEAHVSLAAIVEAYDWNWDAAEREYRRAIELNPALPEAHLWYGMFLRDQGRLKEALPELRRAEMLEPLSVLGNLNLSAALVAAADPGGALEHALRAVELAPQLPAARLMAAGMYRKQSDSAHADAALAEALRLASDNPHALASVACAYAGLGRRAESQQLLTQVQQMASRRYVSPFDLANVSLQLGDEDRALQWFEEAYNQRSAGMVSLRTAKSECVRRSPRLLTLLGKMNAG